MDSSAHLAARRGELEKLKMLFETGEASPFDTSYDGQTLLEGALSCTSLNTAQFLIDQCPSLGHKIDLLVLQRLAWGWWCWLEFESDLAVYTKDTSQAWDFLSRYIDIDEDTLHGVEQYFHARDVLDKWAERLPLFSKGPKINVQVLPRELRMSLASNATSLSLFKGLVGTDISIREILKRPLYA